MTAHHATCAIHQPNLFPRVSTLRKIAEADIWVVRDDVQDDRRDYQHRTRLARLADQNAAAVAQPLGPTAIRPGEPHR